jgi:hypothetical protein
MGFVYLITSDDLNRVKVGYWNGSLFALHSRYATPLGLDATLYYFAHPQPEWIEDSFIRHFKECNITQELFEKRGLEEYIRFLENECGCVRTLLQRQKKRPKQLRMELNVNQHVPFMVFTSFYVALQKSTKTGRSCEVRNMKPDLLQAIYRHLSDNANKVTYEFQKELLTELKIVPQGTSQVRCHDLLKEYEYGNLTFASFNLDLDRCLESIPMISLVLNGTAMNNLDCDDRTAISLAIHSAYKYYNWGEFFYNNSWYTIVVR